MGRNTELRATCRQILAAILNLRYPYRRAISYLSLLSRVLATMLASAVALAIDCYLLVLIRRRWKEKFSAESFAFTVIAQNPKVFQRLAEM